MARTGLLNSTNTLQGALCASAVSSYDYSLYAGTSSSMHPVARRSVIESDGAVRAALRAEERRCNAQAKAAARRDVLILAFVLLIFIGGMFLAWQPSQSAATVQSVAVGSFEVLTVSSGDTLWSIAEQFPVPGLSTREGVLWIMEHNGLASSTIQPGQVIEVPRTYE